MRNAIDKTKNVPIMKKVIKVFTILPPSFIVAPNHLVKVRCTD